MLQTYWLIAALIDIFIVYKSDLLASVWGIIPAVLMHILILALLCGLHLLFVIIYSFTVDRNEDVTNIHNSYRVILLSQSP